MIGTKTSTQVINLTDTPTKEAIALASLSEKIKITVHGIQSPKVVIPVKVKVLALPMDYLEELVEYRLANHEEYRLLQKMYRLLEDDIEQSAINERKEVEKEDEYEEFLKMCIS